MKIRKEIWDNQEREKEREGEREIEIERERERQRERERGRKEKEKEKAELRPPSRAAGLEQNCKRGREVCVVCVCMRAVRY